MNLTDLSTRQWPSVAVGVALVALFGLTSIANLPIQLLPDIEEPQISVANFWRAAAPEEMEANIIEPQENVLRNTPGLTNINSFISRGQGFVNLTFAVGTDIQTAKLDVINNLTQAPPRPADALEPQVNTGGGGQTPGAASLLVRVLPDNPVKELAAYQKLIEDKVHPRLAQIPGVSQVFLAGEQPLELQITFDSYRAAALGIQINDIIATVSRASDTSGGFADVGRRQYTVRFVGQFEPEELNELIVGWSADRPIYLNEVADVAIVPRALDGFTKRNGFPAYYITVQRDPDANTVSILDGINEAIVELNSGPLREAGLEIDLSFDASVHIRRAIALVKGNLGIGLILAVGVLYFLMRSRRATFLVTATVPLSVLVAFLALRVFDKSLNVISLAGLAFSVGLVMDAAIVTLENIVRCRQKGAPLSEAVGKGTRQITGALFASTVTSVAIFLPVLFMEGMEGQLFQDLALTIAVAVSASFLIAITVLPVAASFMLREERADPCAHWWDKITSFVMSLTRTPMRCAAWAGGILVASVLAVILLVPKANLLPQAPSDSLNAFFAMPPGGTVEMLEAEIARPIVERLKPYMDHEKQPYIRGYNLSSFGTFNALFVYPLDPSRIEEMIEIVRNEVLIDLPDTQAFVQRSSLLNFGFDGGRAINVDLQGPDMDALSAAAMSGMQIISEAVPGAQVRPNPGLAIAEPELQLVPNDRRITAAGMDRATVANVVRALTSGTFVGEYFDGNDRMDMILKGPTWSTPEELAAIPIATPLAGIQTIGELTDIERTVGPTQLLRVNGQRTITLSVTPPEAMTVQEALEQLRNVADPQLRDAVDGSVSIAYRGTADRLEAAFGTMTINLLVAAIVLFLILAAMFRSLTDALLVMLSMPLAIAGGVLMLRVLNLFTTQSMDLLTTIGFLILLGLVVNNAILLVMQTRTGQRNGLDRTAAVAEAVRVRARPIYMSTLTSIFGMLPLMLVPGVGSQIYRGLATVIIGGMLVSALFTLILMPSILRLPPLRFCSASGATPTQQPELQPMRRMITIVAVLAIASPTVAQQPPAATVQVASVSSSELSPTIAVPGTIYSRNDLQVTAGVTGQLMMVAEPGTFVAEGGTVAIIDTRPLQLQRAEQEALLQRAQINIRQLESQLRRQRELQSSNLVSEFELEQTEANRDLAISDANITRVRIRQIDDQIERANITAPFAGVVISRTHRGGEDVARGEVLARMTDTRNMEVRAFVPLKYLPRTGAGDTIDVFASDARVTARIRALVPTGDVRSQTFEARIDLPVSAAAEWTVGQLVSVAVPMRARELAMTVPRDALVLRSNGAFVFRVNSDNIAEQVAVEVGDSSGELIAVRGALEVGDRVAIRGAENLRDGAGVKIMVSSSVEAGNATAIDG